tara:strand:- start:171 stop:443 length:273 start_codon:yes stop_codon:yes gene_type:complete
MKKPKNLILPESIVLDLMALTSRLGEIAIDYNNKVGGKETNSLVNLYTRVVRKLMSLEYEDVRHKEKFNTFSLDELLDDAGISKPNKEDE